MSKHTQGPWVAVHKSQLENIDCLEIAEISDMRVIPARGGWPANGTPETDARLIAAAPELLKALKACLPHVLKSDLPLGNEYIDAVAAIAKATGETT